MDPHNTNSTTHGRNDLSPRSNTNTIESMNITEDEHGSARREGNRSVSRAQHYAGAGASRDQGAHSSQSTPQERHRHHRYNIQATGGDRDEHGSARREGNRSVSRAQHYAGAGASRDQGAHSSQSTPQERHRRHKYSIQETGGDRDEHGSARREGNRSVSRAQHYAGAGASRDQGAHSSQSTPQERHRHHRYNIQATGGDSDDDNTPEYRRSDLRDFAVAAYQGNMHKCKKYITKYKIPPDTCEEGINTPLIEGILNVNRTNGVMEYLIQNSRNLDVEDKNGYTALRATSFLEPTPEIRITQMLLEQGANPDQGFHSHFGVDTPLCNAIRSKKPEIAELLIKHGANVDLACQEGYRPIEIAAKSGNEENMILCLSAGADIFAKSHILRHNQTVADSIAKMGKWKALGIAIENLPYSSFSRMEREVMDRIQTRALTYLQYNEEDSARDAHVLSVIESIKGKLKTGVVRSMFDTASQVISDSVCERMQNDKAINHESSLSNPQLAKLRPPRIEVDASQAASRPQYPTAGIGAIPKRNTRDASTQCTNIPIPSQHHAEEGRAMRMDISSKYRSELANRIHQMAVEEAIDPVIQQGTGQHATTLRNMDHASPEQTPQEQALREQEALQKREQEALQRERERTFVERIETLQIPKKFKNAILKQQPITRSHNKEHTNCGKLDNLNRRRAGNAGLGK